MLGASGPADSATRGGALSPAEQAARAAELALRVVASAREHSWPDGSPLQVRVGVHCGSLTTGVVGGALPRWGVFGRNVIIASRMESTGAPDRVHASAEFAVVLRGAGAAASAFVLRENRAMIKGVGERDTFWVERVGQKPAPDAAPAPASAPAALSGPTQPPEAAAILARRARAR